MHNTSENVNPVSLIDLNSRSALTDRINWHVDAALDRLIEPHRAYLGCSVLGDVCERAVQFEALATVFEAEDVAPVFPARIRRIFHRGHEAENWCAAWLRRAGFVLVTEDPAGVDTPDGGQYAVEFCAGRVRGHADGILCFWRGEGVAPLPLPALWEAKCLGAKGWRDAVKNGIRTAYPKYFAQMQLYMGGLRLERGLITLLNADTMDFHHELVAFDKTVFDGLISRAERVLAACDFREMLPRCSRTEADVRCRLCRHSEMCWRS